MTDTTPEDLAQRIAALSPAKRAMLEALLQRGSADIPATPARPEAIPRRADPSLAPLSFAQQRIWFMEQLLPDTAMYHMGRRIRVEGRLDPVAFERALQEIIARHESLRTAFPSVNGEPSQLVSPGADFRLELSDLTSLSSGDREAEAQRLTAQEIGQRFDLAHGPLVRGRLIRFAPDDHLLVLVLHHIISDGWSMGVLFQELGTLYAGFAAGSPADLPPLPIQYADYAAWQREWLQGPVLAKQLAYWKKQFEVEAPPLDLPFKSARDHGPSHAGASVPIVVPEAITARLEEISRRERATLFMTVLAAFECLLHRYTGQTDIVVGSPIAGRTRAELEGLIGFFVNNLSLRTDLSGDPTFRELVARTREVAFGAFEHQDLPFERLVQELHPDRDPDANPLFQVVFVLQNAPSVVLEMPGLRLTRIEGEASTAKFDLVLNLSRAPEGLKGVLNYSTQKFERETIRQVTTHFGTLLEAIAANPDARLSTLPLMRQDEERALVQAWNAGETAAPGDPCAHRALEQHAVRTPREPAVMWDGGALSYDELNRRADRLAERLRALGVGTDVRVGLLARRSPELLVGLLGIVKAGGAYVPLDPGYPIDRLAYMLRDSGARALVADRQLAEGGTFTPLANVVPLETISLRDPLEAATEPASTPEKAIGGDGLVYVMYTSGSTGAPKAVGVPHNAVANFARAAARLYGLNPSDRVLQFASISFDVSIDEIFPAWDSGAAVVLAPEGPLSPAEVSSTIDRHQVTVVSLPTAFWHLWVQELQASRSPLPRSLRLLIVGGEKVQPAAFAAWRELETGHIRWLNTYGPTETTVEATAWQWPSDEPPLSSDQEVPLGRAVAGASIYVLDRHLNPVPPGVKGELYIGGPGLARGYLERPAQTAAAFLPDRLSPTPGTRMYRTGDLVRYRSDGNLEFVGRADSQVKIRGYRVELPEIELVLGRHPAVADCAVVAREDVPLDRRLVAYIATRQASAPAPEELRQFLAERLPSYMVPSVIVVLPALPMTRTGKVDRRALPAPGGVQAAPAYRAPASATEETIAGIWQRVLRVERVGATDNFFDLGGHSLLATQVVARVRSALGVDLPLRILFEHPTVEGLALAVTARQAEADPTDLTDWLARLEDRPDPV